MHHDRNRSSAAALGGTVVEYHCEAEAALGRQAGVTDPARLKSVTMTRRDLREGKFNFTLNPQTREVQIAVDPDVLNIAGPRQISQYKEIGVTNGPGKLITFALVGDPVPDLSCGPDEGDACSSIVRIAAFDFNGPIDFNIDMPAKATTTKGLERHARVVGRCAKVG